MLELLRAERPDDGVIGRGGRGGRRAAARRRGCSIRSTARSTTRAGCPPGARRSRWSTPRARSPAPSTTRSPASSSSAARGAGATLNGAPLRLGSAPPLGEATVATFVDVRRRDPEIAAGTAALLERIGALRADGCGSLELAWVAAGGCTAGSRPTSSRGTGIPARCWWPRRAARSRSRALARRGGERRAARRPAGGRSLLRVSETRRNPASELTTDRPPSIADAVGGPLGVAESVAPVGCVRRSPTRSPARTRRPR